MFSAPLWLFGLAALAIPIILHLWSRRPRQVIRVGSLRHVDTGADPRSWSARLTDPLLLLLLRVALLTAIVFALAGLRLPARRLGGSAAGVTLVDPSLLEGEHNFPFLDSLVRSRETVRLLLPGLPRVQLDPSLRAKQLTANGQRPAALWFALAEADALVGPSGTITVLASPRVVALTGRRPTLQATVVWYAPTGGEHERWTAVRWQGARDSVVSLAGEGNTQGAAYSLARAVQTSCDSCRTEMTRHFLIRTAGDSTLTHRLALALATVAQERGEAVALVASLDSADALVTLQPLDDSLLAITRPIVTFAAPTVNGGGLADSLWAHWPWPIVGTDQADPRVASTGQALPLRTLRPVPIRGDPETTRHGLLLLALLLFVLERWLATQPGRRVL